jgi:hypothetical protein
LGAHGAFPVVSTLVFYVARAAGMADWNATALEAQRATISLNIVWIGGRSSLIELAAEEL